MVAKKAAKPAKKKAKEEDVEAPPVDEQLVDRLRGEIEQLEGELDEALHPQTFTLPSN